MGKLTASQVAALVGKSVYTVKRWYNWYESLTEDEIAKYNSQGMPRLPKYETIGNTQWRYWNSEDIDILKEFSEWVPHTRGGMMASKLREN